jgi:hypothetical protein
MKQVMVRYRLKAERLDENLALIGRVFDALAREQPAGLRYASFRVGDGLGFVHLAAIDTPDGSNPLAALPAFRAFTAQIGARCDEPPLTTELTPVGSYGF